MPGARICGPIGFVQRSLKAMIVEDMYVDEALPLFPEIKAYCIRAIMRLIRSVRVQ